MEDSERKNDGSPGGGEIDLGSGEFSLWSKSKTIPAFHALSPLFIFSVLFKLILFTFKIVLLYCVVFIKKKIPIKIHFKVCLSYAQD